MTQFPDAYELKKMALEEYNSDVTTAHHGIPGGREFLEFRPCLLQKLQQSGTSFLERLRNAVYVQSRL